MTDHPWPTPLQPAAYHGVLGEIVKAIAPQTEADPAAILVQLLTEFGSCAGRTPIFRVGADIHHVNLFSAVVGTTAKGRKGMSRGQAQRPFEDADPDWVKGCVTSGLSSGEGLIWAVRDQIIKKHAIKKGGRVIGYDSVIEDDGINDKRLCVVETEFASTLKVMTREGSTLSAVLRQAWDGYDLRTLVKHSAARSTGAHISVIAHITAAELRRYLEATEAASGFGNRFLWVLAKRSRELPHGGQLLSLDRWTHAIGHALMDSRNARDLTRDASANQLWEQVYSQLSAGRPGMLGAMTARAEAQVMRVACIYALADRTHTIGLPHLQAALELWRYCFQSTTWLFGDQLGDPVADPILSRLRQAYPESVTRTEIRDLFHRHQPASVIDQALALLQEYKLATVEFDRGRRGEGRPTERWCFTDDITALTDPVMSADVLSQPDQARPPHERL